MEELISLDHALFFKVNQEWTSSWADAFFPNITDLHKTPLFALPFLAGLLALFVYAFRWKKGSILFGLYALVVGLNDMFVSQVLKASFERPRPPHTNLEVIVRCPEHGGASFPSNHASNMFCACVFLGFFFPRARWYLIGLAAVVSYSRVYCGVHFPADVVTGALVGTLIGTGAALALRHLQHSPLRGLKWQRS